VSSEGVSPAAERRLNCRTRIIQAGNQIGENFWKMVLAEHGLDLNGVRVSLPFLCSVCQIFSFLLGRVGREDVSRHGPITARARKLPFFLAYSCFLKRKKKFYFLQVETYFSEVESGSVSKYVPRSVQIDLEAGVCDRLRSGPTGALFKPDTFITGEGGAGNNWAKGCSSLPFSLSYSSLMFALHFCRSSLH
jgi:tubulin beta